MIYNMDFLISAMVILLLILWHFLGQKRAEDLNNRVFLFFAVLGTADVVAEFFTNYYITSYNRPCFPLHLFFTFRHCMSRKSFQLRKCLYPVCQPLF